MTDELRRNKTQRAIRRAITAGKEVCLCAAILACGRVFPGMRHGDCMQSVEREFGWTMTRKQMMQRDLFRDQGFLTNRNRYVSREWALKQHQALEIPSADKGGYRNKIMFSEDLY